ncbi:hypothetical protein [Ralstonia soli]|nr:hypothetical protein [Ralstonia soli]
MATCKWPMAGLKAPTLMQKAASPDLLRLIVDEKSSSDGALSLIGAEKSINAGASKVQRCPF